MATRYVMQRDTKAWQTQVWSSFILAVLACAYGVINMPGDDLDRAFLSIGLFFTLFACFAVAKTERDNRDGQVDSQGWVMMVWVALAGALSLTAWGLWRMQIEGWFKSYMLVSWLFLISTTFTLAKMLRDKHEAELMARAAATERAEKNAPASSSTA